MKTFHEFLNESLDDLNIYLDINLKQEDYWYKNDKLYIEINKLNCFKVLSMLKTIERKYHYYLATGNTGIIGDDDFNFNYFRKYIRYNVIEMIKNYGEENLGDNETVITLTFEPKFGDITFGIPNLVYHITDLSKIKNIKSKGLLPKNSNKISYHPKRIYLLKNKEDVNDLIKHNKFNVVNPVLLTIDLSKIKNLDFYKDINYPKGFFINDKIDPKYIINYENINI